MVESARANGRFRAEETPSVRSRSALAQYQDAPRNPIHLAHMSFHLECDWFFWMAPVRCKVDPKVFSGKNSHLLSRLSPVWTLKVIWDKHHDVQRALFYLY
jgi:hypothetical protein